MIPFLMSVAKAYASRYSDLSDVLFLFPNKRAGTFFLKYLHGAIDRSRPVIAPRVLPVEEFIERLSGLVIADRLTLLFHLFSAYRDFTGISDPDADKAFDRFISWGETVIRDFGEVDRYLVDPDEIFRNVKDLREISTDFLTDEQREVMSSYFGYTASSETIGGFWRTFNEPEEGSALKERFIYLWQILAPLYHRLDARLEKEGLTSTGGAYRRALAYLDAILEEDGADSSRLSWKKVVAVGFNALSTSEIAIFRRLRKLPGCPGFDSFADFFWDATGPVLDGGDNSASHFVDIDRREFPSPQWALPFMELSDAGSMTPVVNVVAAPSNTVQTKIAGRLLSDMRGRLPGSDFTEARVAVVLPDESLLLPMLYSLPDDIGDINLTMGYSIRLTAVSSFMNLLRRSYLNRRKKNGMLAYFHRDIRRLMNHPLTEAIVGIEGIRAVTDSLNSHHQYLITLDELRALAPGLHRVLDIPDGDSAESLRRLDSLLAEAADAMLSAGGVMLKRKLETEHIMVFRRALTRLADLMAEHGMERLSLNAVFMLTDRLLAGAKVVFEGEPLRGLQVMGVLETRALDFDCLVIPSMNERIMPMKARARTFIPDTLRRGYGMPPSNYSESIFSYYFYRMISRAREVDLIYDARSSGGMRSGDVSRYILQLRHLFAPRTINEETCSFNLRKKLSVSPDIQKTGRVREDLERFFDPEQPRYNLNATNLNCYRECQKKFYYRHVLKLPEEEQPSDFMDPITQGNIVHSMMEHVYTDRCGRMLAKPVLVTADTIRAILDDRERLQVMMTRTVNSEHYHMPDEELDRPLEGATAMIAERLLWQVMRILRYDLKLAPIYIYGVEISENMRYELGAGKGTVNMKFAIDRLDRVTLDGMATFRIIDYKTGSVHIECDTVDEVIDGGYATKQIFQLFLYSWLLSKREGEMPSGTTDVRVEIYDIPRLTPGRPGVPKIAKETVKSYAPYAEWFDGKLHGMVNEIFDMETPFRPCAEESSCRLCAYRSLCGR